MSSLVNNTITFHQLMSYELIQWTNAW